MPEKRTPLPSRPPLPTVGLFAPEVSNVGISAGSSAYTVITTPTSPLQWPYLYTDVHNAIRVLPIGSQEIIPADAGNVFSLIPDYAYLNTFLPIIEAVSDQTSIENKLNQLRLQSYKNMYSQEFLDTIRETDLEYGYESTVDVFLRSLLSQNALATKEWISSLFVENINDVRIATGILRTIAHLEYEEIAPQGTTMAYAALSHSSLEVCECGIRAFENWATSESLKALKTVRCQDKWLKKYVRKVISDLGELLGDG